MKQTKRAILEVSGAPQVPLLISSKMLHSYKNFEIKFGLPILSKKILQMNRSSESKQERPIQLHIKTHNSPSTSLCMIPKLIFVQALDIYHKQSICVIEMVQDCHIFKHFYLTRFLWTVLKKMADFLKISQWLH